VTGAYPRPETCIGKVGPAIQGASGPPAGRAAPATRPLPLPPGAVPECASTVKKICGNIGVKSGLLILLQRIVGDPALSTAPAPSRVVQFTVVSVGSCA
jgi:hypothetical protein